MSDLASQPLQNSGNFSQSPAFADALQRAKQIAAKINPGASPVGQKRPLEGDMDNLGPDGKRPAGMGSDPFGPPGMGGGAPPANPMLGGIPGMGAAAPPLGIAGVESEDIMIPDRMVGLIIGRGGESINRLQNESGAKIQMSPQSIDGTSERTCTLTGSHAAVARAKELINAIVASRASEMGRGPGGGGGGGGGGGLSDMMGGELPGQTTSEMMVPSSKVGLIIGKGGETIKQLQDNSGSKMVVVQDGQYANAPEKPLRITGDQKQIERAKQLVFELMAEKDNYGPGGGGGGGGRNFGRGGGYGSSSQEVTVPQAAVGVVIGKGGEMIKKVQNDTGANIQFQPNVSGRNERLCTVTGTPDQIEHAKVIIQDLIESVMKRDQMGGRNGGGWGGPGGFRGPPMSRDGKQEVSCPVPANRCGVVIGKGGETIKAINQQSGAHCELDRRPPPNPNDKIFVIRGSPDQVEHARRLICEKVGIPCGPGGPGGPPFGGPGGPGPGGPFPPQGWGGNFPPQGGPGGPGVWGQQQGDPGKQDGWNNYYGQYYGGQGGPGGPGGAPQPQPQPGQQGMAQQGGGQQDYSAAWAEYYRNMGMIREAEAIEQQSKAKQQPAAAAAAAQPAAQPAAGQQAANGGQADYSAQWVEYYRSQGLIAEAEKLEQQIKNQKAQQAGQPQPGAAPAAGAPAAGYGQPQQQYGFSGGYGGGAGGGGGAPGGYGQYGGYPGAGDN